MPTNILMPSLSQSMDKGAIVAWLKSEGDEIKIGDVIAEIETDKATMDYEARDAGVLAKIVAPAGANDIPVNAVIAVLAGAGEDVKAVAASATGAAAAAAKPSATTLAPVAQRKQARGRSRRRDRSRACLRRLRDRTLPAELASSLRPWRAGSRRRRAST